MPMSPRRALILSTAAVLVPVLTGCEGESSASRRTHADVDAAAALIAAGAPDEAEARLREAVGRESSDASKAQAYRLLGFTQQLKGREQMAQAAAAQAEADRVAFEVVALADAVADGNALVAELEAADPQPTLERIEQLSGEIAGEGGGETWTVGDVELPTLATLRQEISRLEGQVADLEAQQEEAGSARDRLRGDSARRFEEADRLGGARGMAEFRAAVEAQQEATAADTRRRALDRRLLPLRQQLELARVREQQLTATQDALSGLRDETTSTWQGVQATLGDQREKLQQLVSGDGGEAGTMDGASIASRAALLAERLAAAATAAGEADAALAAAADSFTSAGSSAGRVTGNAGVVTKQDYDVLAGAAKYDRGMLHQILATGQALRLAAADAVADAGGVAGAPEGLDAGTVRADLQASLDTAQASLTDAADTLGGARSGRGGPAVGSSASLLTAVSNYALAQLATLGADVGLVEDGQQQAQAFLTAAREAAADLDPAAARNLPAEITGGNATPPSDEPEQDTEADEETQAEVESDEDMEQEDMEQPEDTEE